MNKEDVKINTDLSLSELEELKKTIQERVLTLRKILNAITSGETANYEILNVMNKRRGKPNATFFPDDEALINATKEDIDRQEAESEKYGAELDWCERRLASINRAIEQHKTSSFS